MIKIKRFLATFVLVINTTSLLVAKPAKVQLSKVIVESADPNGVTKNNSKSNKIHAHQPEDPASPAEF